MDEDPVFKLFQEACNELQEERPDQDFSAENVEIMTKEGKKLKVSCLEFWKRSLKEVDEQLDDPNYLFTPLAEVYIYERYTTRLEPPAPEQRAIYLNGQYCIPRPSLHYLRHLNIGHDQWYITQDYPQEEQVIKLIRLPSPETSPELSPTASDEDIEYQYDLKRALEMSLLDIHDNSNSSDPNPSTSLSSSDEKTNKLYIDEAVPSTSFAADKQASTVNRDEQILLTIPSSKKKTSKVNLDDPLPTANSSIGNDTEVESLPSPVISPLVSPLVSPTASEEDVEFQNDLKRALEMSLLDIHDNSNSSDPNPSTSSSSSDEKTNKLYIDEAVPSTSFAPDKQASTVNHDEKILLPSASSKKKTSVVNLDDPVPSANSSIGNETEVERLPSPVISPLVSPLVSPTPSEEDVEFQYDLKRALEMSLLDIYDNSSSSDPYPSTSLSSSDERTNNLDIDETVPSTSSAPDKQASKFNRDEQIPLSSASSKTNTSKVNLDDPGNSSTGNKTEVVKLVRQKTPDISPEPSPAASEEDIQFQNDLKRALEMSLFDMYDNSSSSDPYPSASLSSSDEKTNNLDIDDSVPLANCEEDGSLIPYIDMSQYLNTICETTQFGDNEILYFDDSKDCGLKLVSEFCQQFKEFPCVTENFKFKIPEAPLRPRATRGYEFNPQRVFIRPPVLPIEAPPAHKPVRYLQPWKCVPAHQAIAYYDCPWNQSNLNRKAPLNWKFDNKVQSSVETSIMAPLKKTAIPEDKVRYLTQKHPPTAEKNPWIPKPVPKEMNSLQQPYFVENFESAHKSIIYKVPTKKDPAEFPKENNSVAHQSNSLYTQYIQRRTISECQVKKKGESTIMPTVGLDLTWEKLQISRKRKAVGYKTAAKLGKKPPKRIKPTSEDEEHNNPLNAKATLNNIASQAPPRIVVGSEKSARDEDLSISKVKSVRPVAPPPNYLNDDSTITPTIGLGLSGDNSHIQISKKRKAVGYKTAAKLSGKTPKKIKQTNEDKKNRDPCDNKAKGSNTVIAEFITRKTQK